MLRLSPAVLLLFAAVASAELTVGDAAPPLKTGRWVKGQPVEAIEVGKVYVVEFWATWCGPCVAAIPQLSALQKQYPEVVFIGQNVREEDEALVTPFVEKMGDKMAYRVSLDDKSAGDKGATYTAWMTAAGERGIPTTFVIDRDGKIAWIGHPAGLDQPLAQIVAGRHDRQRTAASRALTKKLEAAMERKDFDTMDRLSAELAKDPEFQLQPLFSRYLRAADKKDYDAMMPLAEQIAAIKPTWKGVPNGLRFRKALDAGDYAAAMSLCQSLVDEPASEENASSLNSRVWDILEKSKTDSAAKLNLDALLKLAEAADRLSGSADGQILDTLAAVHARRGDYAKAVVLQEKAIANTPAGGLADEMRKTLMQYREHAPNVKTP